MKRSINIFSQRNKINIINKKIEISLYTVVRETIYNIFKKYDNDFSYSYIEEVRKELMIYQKRDRLIEGEFVNDMSLYDFLMKDYPSSTLDAIEVFSVMVNDNDFTEDINNVFYNNKLPYTLINNKIEIVDTIKIPNAVTDNMKILKEDIDGHIIKKEYSVILDHLHAYYGLFLKENVTKLNINAEYDENGHIIYSKTNRKIAEFLYNKNIINDFEKQVILEINSLLEKYNNIRNDKSFAHANDNILNNESAEFVVKIISAALDLLDKSIIKYLGEKDEI